MPFIDLDRNPWDERPDCRRSTGRVPVEAVQSSLGPVVNLSARGVRVRLRQRVQVGETHTLVLSIGEEHVTVDATVVWVNRTGLFKSEAGLTFAPDIPEDVRRSLTCLCTACRDRLTIARQQRRAS